jgi:cytochrome c553
LSSRYLASQLRLFVSGERGGTAYHHIMAIAVQDLEEADIDALAAYYAHLPDRQ